MPVVSAAEDPAAGAVICTGATTIFRADGSAELASALRTWRNHISQAHPKIREVRCYRFNAGTSVVWQEGFHNFHDYQDLIDQQDEACEHVMAEVFRHAVPGSRQSAIWNDTL